MTEHSHDHDALDAACAVAHGATPASVVSSAMSSEPGERILVARARKRELAPEEYTGATFLISNLGKFDVESFSAVILPPAATALAVGSVRETPVVRDGRVEVGHRMTLTLSCDHRVIDGAVAAQFLQTFKQALEHPRDL